MENVQQKSVIIKGLILLVSCLLVMGGVVHEGLCQPAMDLNLKVKNGEYVQKVDNFMVILDASDTMNTPDEGKSRWKTALDVVGLLNQTIPNISFMGALRKYSDVGNYYKMKPTVLVYGPKKHYRPGFEQALKKIRKAEGNSPLHLAISAAIKDLSPTRGKIAVIIVTDGAHIPHAPVLKAVDNMKKKFGDRVCIYTVGIGDDQAGRKLLEDVAQAGQCGYFVSAASINSSAKMAEFVANVFLKEVVKPATSPPPDSDRDGVADYLDKCPDTPRGAKVDERGCWVYTGAFLFDFDKWDLKPEDRPALNNAVKVLKENPGLKVEIQGHTCNIGSASYNQKLSLRRAQSVLQYLLDRGIAESRISVNGYGFSKHAYPNDTKEGRAKNRRVEFSPVR